MAYLTRYFFIILFIISLFSPHQVRAQSCPLKPHGDADCNAQIDISDFEIFRKEFIGALQTQTADFDNSGHVDITDFEIWRQGYFGGSPTATISSTVTIAPSVTPHATNCTYPAQILDLTNWKITLPIGTSSPTEIKQPQLATYTIDPWFKPNQSCDGVIFRAHTSAPVTTQNSSYPRSELREMTNNGLGQASWSNSSGMHTMTIDEAVTAVPIGKRHIVAGQIHDASSDVIVIRLEYPKLFVDIGGTPGPTLDPAYTLGKRFVVKFVASGGLIKIFYNGAIQPAYTLTKTISNSYFKAGAYTQSNCAKEQAAGATCSPDNYGEVVIYNVAVTHQ